MLRRLPTLAALLSLACGQAAVVGAGDPFPGDPRLGATEVAQCSAGGAAVLEGHRPPVDRSAGGRLSGPTLPATGRPIRHLVALDYSGSMFGGYERGEPSPRESGCGWTAGRGGARSPNGPFYWQIPAFRDLVRDGPLATLAAGDPARALVFNKDVFALGDGSAARWTGRGFTGPLPGWEPGPDAVLGRLVSEEAGGTLPARWVAPWATARMWDESRMADVLDAAAALLGEGAEQDGILWIVTDNIIETSEAEGRAREAELNRQFYLRLKEDPRWQVVHAWPIHGADWLCGGTLMVYGLYFSGHERIDAPTYAALAAGDRAHLASPAQIQAFARYANPGSPAPGHPFKLKPDDLDLLKVSFERDIECPAARAGQRRECEATLTIENLLKHRRIEGAKLHLASGRLDAWGQVGDTLVTVPTARPLQSGAVTADGVLAEPVAPGGRATLRVPLLVPAIETEEHTLRDHWVSANHERFRMLGSMTVSISDLRTSMAVDEAQLGDVYGVASLPEIFRNPDTSNLTTTICLTMGVENPAWLASLLILGALALGLLAILLGVWLLKPTFRIVAIDDREQGRIRVTRLVGAGIEHQGKTVARVRQGLGGALRVAGVKPWRVRSLGGHWELTDGDRDAGERHRLELRTRSRPRPRGGSGDGF